MREVFNSTYCIFVFATAFVVGLLILPKQVLYGWYLYLALTFVLLFALNMACFVHALKAQFSAARSGGAGLLTSLATVVGLSALSVCGVGAPICGAALGTTALTILLPVGVVHYFTAYAVQIVIAMIVVQIISLWYMKCFRFK